MDKDSILKLTDNPTALESLYRTQPNQFRAVFPDAFSEKPDSLLFKAWHERLFFDVDRQPSSGESKTNALIWTMLLSIITTVLVKFGQVTSFIDSAWYYQRFTALFITSAIGVYFLSQYQPSQRIFRLLVGGVVVCMIFIGILPAVKDSDTALLTVLYTPFIIWSGVYLAYAGEKWRSAELRMNFIRFNGELLVFSAVILLGGIVLTMITFALFSLIN